MILTKIMQKMNSWATYKIQKAVSQFFCSSPILSGLLWNYLGKSLWNFVWNLCWGIKQENLCLSWKKNSAWQLCTLCSNVFSSVVIALIKNEEQIFSVDILPFLVIWKNCVKLKIDYHIYILFFFILFPTQVLSNLYLSKVLHWLMVKMQD